VKAYASNGFLARAKAQARAHRVKKKIVPEDNFGDTSKYIDVFWSLLTFTDIQIQPWRIERGRHCHLSGLGLPPGLPLPSLPLGLPYLSDGCPLTVPRLISLHLLPLTSLPPLCPLVTPHGRHWRHPQIPDSIEMTMKRWPITGSWWAPSPGVRVKMAQPSMIAWCQHRQERAGNGAARTKSPRNLRLGRVETRLPAMIARCRRRERARNGAARMKNLHVTVGRP
jgi:hypothetical protein